MPLASLGSLRRPFVFVAVLACFALASATASATTFYADQTGASFFFQNMQEDTTTAGDPEPIFGAPTVSGDTLIFTPTAFASNASGGASDQTNGTFRVDIVSQDNTSIAIEELLVTELGDYSLTGAGTSGTTASALAGAFLVINEVNVAGSIIATALATSVTDFVSFDTPTQAGGWTLSLYADISAFLDPFYSDDVFATSVSVVWNNDLATNSELGTTAQIQKKIGLPAVTMEVIPEPGTGLLVGMGLLGMALRRR